MTIEEFVSCLEKENISISPRQLEQFHQYYTLLVDWNQRMNLTAITKQEEVYEKHFLDCIYAIPFFAIAIWCVVKKKKMLIGAMFLAIIALLALYTEYIRRGIKI